MGQPKLLGSGNGTKTLTVTLDHDVPAQGTLQLVIAPVQTPSASGHFVTMTAVDTNGHTWTDHTDPGPGAPLIGLIQQFNDDPPHDEDLQVGSVARACAEGDLHAGDTVTLTFTAPGGPGQVFHSSGLLVYVPAPFTTVKQNGVNQYGNASGYPDLAGDGATVSSLTWVNPPAIFNDYPTPDGHAVMISGMTSYPPSVFTPFETTKIGEITSGVCSLAACFAVVPQGVGIDPGGSWAGVAELLVANYQFQTARNPANFSVPHPLKAHR